MIVLSNQTAQTIQPGELAVLNYVVQRSGCDALWPGGSGPLHIKCGIYDLEFTGNLSGAAGTQPNLAITVDGVPLAETTMTVSVGADGEVYNVHAGTRRKNCFGGAVVSVQNVGTTPVTLSANPALVVERKG